jgi:hypothetical protein
MASSTVGVPTFKSELVSRRISMMVFSNPRGSRSMRVKICYLWRSVVVSITLWSFSKTKRPRYIRFTLWVPTRLTSTTWASLRLRRLFLSNFTEKSLTSEVYPLWTSVLAIDLHMWLSKETKISKVTCMSMKSRRIRLLRASCISTLIKRREGSNTYLRKITLPNRILFLTSPSL